MGVVDFGEEGGFLDFNVMTKVYGSYLHRYSGFLDDLRRAGATCES